ncbi:hypothetical protein PVOR_20144 [Paenibacillus vortex V453]|uniref:Uncharacterized protein n=1 Tax=Paenibacillus vortex V453 TaxID=715225 RepID=A0A2R9SQP1_9BACL|nr:hypothetical protein PVOR_20144 [Paenibacillus vortex V453]
MLTDLILNNDIAQYTGCVGGNQAEEIRPDGIFYVI